MNVPWKKWHFTQRNWFLKHFSWHEWVKREMFFPPTKSVMAESDIRSDKSQISRTGIWTHECRWLGICGIMWHNSSLDFHSHTLDFQVIFLCLFFIFTATVIVIGIYNHSVWQFMHSRMTGVKQGKISEMWANKVLRVRVKYDSPMLMAARKRWHGCEIFIKVKAKCETWSVLLHKLCTSDQGHMDSVMDADFYLMRKCAQLRFMHF